MQHILNRFKFLIVFSAAVLPSTTLAKDFLPLKKGVYVNAHKPCMHPTSSDGVQSYFGDTICSGLQS